ncbi:MAG TPA: hypothetical protein VET23_14865 [Chitinophagaceae bacterium]|nr:hypothetical protein [Chitinophagaceae bacterium]
MREKNSVLPADKADLETLKDIRQLMEKSSRFISLSGWSGIAAGVCALLGIYLARVKIGCWKIDDCLFPRLLQEGGGILQNHLFVIAAGTFASAFILAFLFTWMRSKKDNVPLWGPVARRLMWSVAGTIIVGGVFLYNMIELKQYQLIAPGCLLFYGLALVNASKYTLSEVRYLGYAEIGMGLISCWMTGYGLYFLAAGFGILHIFYGIIMWSKYERRKAG